MAFPVGKNREINLSLNSLPMIKLHNVNTLVFILLTKFLGNITRKTLIYNTLIKFVGIFYKLCDKLLKTV